ncbi:MAG: hypothetical protein EZS26_003241 [Candidatus Ordinivivax streblomastigis]|uniref:Uncharacterized protein n=1 Tax=Candidatus Ordinivivax streblomastigis TaxID=2540710 RepID=A0A5M8NWA2_9BACT|nr:MAG: hypothetical protein EZS26_003241 [Candidatus Ordinivivax streblomastigis]
MKLKSFVSRLLCGLALASAVQAQQASSQTETFSDTKLSLKITGRGDCKIENGVLKSKDAYVCFGNPNWKNYRITFKARVSDEAEQVQIWAGFRSYNRFDRYIVGFRGGLQDYIYLSLMGYMVKDEFLGIRQLEFHT